ncbi:unnamed protein product [Onchocerca flexuosa]|uniref:Lipase_3 domain-containing protein n=1 Tax=Onchocerca flexuosa TaxID=387005 RepID=A0A183H7D9_9BILA|nr:unnamed protein product [Onchocerca flexuosa]
MIYLLTTFNRAVHALFPLVIKYNETEAKILTLPKWQKWLVYSIANTNCDAFQNSCSSYIIRSDVLKEIIVVFRGTTTTKQLIMEGWQSMRSNFDFFGIGSVNRYFSQALDAFWPNIEPLLKDSVFKSYGVTFTGHSLGGAIASLAATRTVIQNLRTGDKIKLVSFGQPRTGDYQFAMYHNAHIPSRICKQLPKQKQFSSFRLVHRLDLVPHLPPCKKNKSYSNANKSKPCLTGNNGSPYHHGTEIWYPYGMNKGAKYYECLGKPRGEDFSCSDGLSFNFSHYKIYVRDHRHYFNVDVSVLIDG